MIELNKVLIVGRLTRDPEEVANPSTEMVKLGIAVNRRRKDAEETSFFDVVVFGKTAEFVSQYFSRGKAIFIEGRLQQDTWEKDGQKRSKVVIIADRASFAESKSESEGGDGSTTSAGPSKSESMQVASNPPVDGPNQDDLPF